MINVRLQRVIKTSDLAVKKRGEVGVWKVYKCLYLIVIF